MDKNFNINIKIGERQYPITIEGRDSKKEELLRKASTVINATLLDNKQKYKSSSLDDQDYLAITLIELVVKNFEEEIKKDIAPVINELKKINFVLEETLT